MRKLLLLLLLCVLPMTSGAAVIYRVQKTGAPTDTADSIERISNKYRFYVGAMLDLAMRQSAVAENFITPGKMSVGVDGVVGFRLADTFRMEMNYVNSDAKWDAFSIGTNSVFINAIVDGRVGHRYRRVYNQTIVPYVGVGLGLSWLSGDGIDVGKDMVGALAAMAGVGLEFIPRIGLDVGYRYVYNFNPDVDIAPNLRIMSHQVRVGARINF